MRAAEQNRPFYDYALLKLQTAHSAVFGQLDRPTLGMSRGPFSGVNDVLGLVVRMERLLVQANALIARLPAEDVNRNVWLSSYENENERRRADV